MNLHTETALFSRDKSLLDFTSCENVKKLIILRPHFLSRVIRFPSGSNVLKFVVLCEAHSVFNFGKSEREAMLSVSKLLV